VKSRQSDTGSPLVPERIGRYDILLPIASGGMATVYLARTRSLGGFEKEVAVKVMHAHLREEEAFAQDIVEEAKLAVRIQHPNVVRVHDVGEDPHGVYLVMDYVEGDSLAGLVRCVSKKGELLPASIGLRILIDSLHGLHAAHELTDKSGELVGLVHRDFSPQNILVGLDGITQLTDFGVAKASTRLSHTATGLVKGKVHYMSPEQAKTEPLDRRCDIWAAGVIAWELLAKRRLYPERNEATILLQLITEPPARLRTVARDVPQALEDAVAHALTPQMSARCPTARQLADALEFGAESIGGVASHADVATFVKGMSGQHLTTRREQASKVLSLRASISSIAKEATVDSEIATPSGFGADVAPGVGDDLQQDETVALVTPQTRLTPEAVTPEAVTPEALLTPEATAEPEVTRTTGAIPVARPPVRNRWALAAALAAVVIGGLGWAAISRGDGAKGSAALPPPSTATAADRTAAAPSETPSAAAATASREPVQVEIVANAKVADLVIGERAVALDPAMRFELEIRGHERDKTQSLRAISVDGRRTEATWEPGTSKVELTFAAKSPAPQARPVGLPPSPKPKGGSLAPNPFDN
jgi:eukaryotic-like serine/threonine-protein kinase